MSSNFWYSKFVIGFLALVFIAGGGYSVWRHQKSAGQPVAEVSVGNDSTKLATGVANLASNIASNKFKVVDVPLKKKSSRAKSGASVEKYLVAQNTSSPTAPAPIQHNQSTNSNPEQSTPQQDSQPAPQSADTQTASNTSQDAIPTNSQPSTPTNTSDRGPAPAPEPTPSPTPSPTPAPEPIKILISEILFNALGSDTGKEFIELYNPTNADRDLNNWSLKIAVGTSTTQSSVASFGSKSSDITKIKAHGFLLIGTNSYSGTPAGDIVRGSASALSNATSTIYLYTDSNQIMDQTTYDGSLPEGQSWERQNYTGDFHAEPNPNPQNSQSPSK